MKTLTHPTEKLNITYVPLASLRFSEYNPRKISKESLEQLKESLRRFDVVDPLVVNSAKNRRGVVIGGHMRLKAAKELGFKQIPVVFVNIPGISREKELNLRLNRNTGEFDLELLAKFNESLLGDVGFSSEELDEVFRADENPEVFDLKKELEKLNIKEIRIKKGDVFEFSDGSRAMCGDSTVEADVMKLMEKEKASMVMTDPPYRLAYLKGKRRNGKATEGFGLKRDRKYLETDELPPDFTEKWTANVAKVAAADFSIICYENWKNIREVWGEMEKHWKVRNMIVWHLPNRVQGFSAKYKFFNKHDIAMVGTSENFELPNAVPEKIELLQNEYETALYATAGKPQWESYEKGKRYCPTDFIEYVAADEKSSGQGIIFGTKPVEILIPYIKVLTRRGELVLEPFGGSGSTAVAALKLQRRFCLMEKSPVYLTVILHRLERIFGKKPKKIA